MARRAGVSVADYRSYDAGTTIFSLEDNLRAFQPGNDFTSLEFAAARIADFLVGAGPAEARPKLDGVLDPRFVRDHASRHAQPGS